MPGGVSPPLAVVLSWPKPNYTDPVTHGRTIIVVMEAVLVTLCYIVVGLRLWSRLFHSKNFGADDALILFNLLPLTALATLLIIGFEKNGWSRHVWDITPEMLVASRKTGLGIEIAYLVSTCTTKVSILLFYRRLGGSVSPKFKRYVHAAIAFVVLFCITYLILPFVQCKPLNAYWNRGNAFWLLAHKTDWYCVDEAATIVAASVISVVQDFIACFLPTVIFARLRIPLRQKIALGGIFGSGIFLSICGVLRLITTVHVYYHTYDLTWESLSVWIWTGIESHCAIIVASLPALNYLFRYFLNETQLGTSMKTYSKRYGGPSSGSRSRSKLQSGKDSDVASRVRSESQNGIIVSHEIKLEEFIDDKRWEDLRRHRGRDDSEKRRQHDERQWTRGTNFVDEESGQKYAATSTWLADDASFNEDTLKRQHSPELGHQGAVITDPRRFY